MGACTSVKKSKLKKQATNTRFSTTSSSSQNKPNQTKHQKQVNITNQISYRELKGEGRNGQIYCGLSSKTGEIVAIKIFNTITTDKRNLIWSHLDKLFELRHKNILGTIPVIDIASPSDEALSLIYELSNGKSLKDLISKFGILDERVIQWYSKQIVEGIRYLHTKNILHKNLKLNNILVDGNGTIRISDCWTDNWWLGPGEEMYENLLKNPDDVNIDYYVPPFFIQNENKNNLNQSYDLWYLGCVIIEMATGKQPWSHYTFKTKGEFIDFWSKTHLTPIIPKKWSTACQNFIRLFFDYSRTSKNDIYNLIYSSEFFTINPDKLITKANDPSNANWNINEDCRNSTESKNSTNIGKKLKERGIINNCNDNESPSFTISNSSESNSVRLNNWGSHLSKKDFTITNTWQKSDLTDSKWPPFKMIPVEIKEETDSKNENSPYIQDQEKDIYKFGDEDIKNMLSEKKEGVNNAIGLSDGVNN